MKRLFILLAILALVLFAFIGNARASYEVLQLSNASDQTVHAPAKIARVEIVSSKATGKATVKRVSPVTTVGSHIDTYTKTTYTYTTVYSNGVNVVTNTSPYITRHFATPPISYTTNAVVSTYAITNSVPGATAAITNAVTEEITCSGGYGGASPSDKWIVPGDRLFYTGNATGVTVILER